VGFAAALLDDERLIALWARVEDKEDWDALRRALKGEAERRGLKQPMAIHAEVEVIANNGREQK
jgi:hypothetical protein